MTLSLNIIKQQYINNRRNKKPYFQINNPSNKNCNTTLTLLPYHYVQYV